jgi:N-carbamoyl-L-amino-acid hydrolase
MRDDFDALAAIGATVDGGVNRPSLSDAHLAARRWFLERGREAGLETAVDAAQNHSAILRSRRQGARTLLLGSHLDSVPNGGRFDGALGVVAALEVLRAVRDAELDLPVHLEAIDFTDEEGTLVGLLGSRALAGQLSSAALTEPRGGRDAVAAAFARAGLREESIADARRDPAALRGYLELHIEQGPVLEREQTDIGIVTGITGACSFEITFVGAARHAGTTPLRDRRDALLGASAFALELRSMVTDSFAGCVATVGDLAVEPGAFNVVPGRVRARAECRALDANRLAELSVALVDCAVRAGSAWGLDVEIEQRERWQPVATHPDVRAAFAVAATELGLSTVELPSGAGHDCQALAAITPSGMVFVPSVAGVSHDPSEETRWDDCVNGANVLLLAALAIARGA